MCEVCIRHRAIHLPHRHSIAASAKKSSTGLLQRKEKHKGEEKKDNNMVTQKRSQNEMTK